MCKKNYVTTNVILVFLVFVTGFITSTVTSEAQESKMPSTEVITDMISRDVGRDIQKSRAALYVFGVKEMKVKSVSNVRISDKRLSANSKKTIPSGTILYPIRATVTFTSKSGETDKVEDTVDDSSDFYMWQNEFDDWFLTSTKNFKDL